MDNLIEGEIVEFKESLRLDFILQTQVIEALSFEWRSHMELRYLLGKLKDLKKKIPEDET